MLSQRRLVCLCSLPQRSLLTIAQRPLYSAFIHSSFTRKLNVFARIGNGDDLVKVSLADGSDAGDLKRAIIAELQLSSAPNMVRLQRELKGGTHMLLDSSKKLASQGVSEGSKVLVEVLAPTSMRSTATAESLPPPLVFVEERLGGEQLMVAQLPLTQSTTAPFYLTPLEHSGLVHFMQSAPSTTPEMLMLTGTFKSGKTRILHDVLPRMLAARYAASPSTVRRPVIFCHTFTQGVPAEGAAHGLAARLKKFATSVGVQLAEPSAPFLSDLPHVAAELAKGVQQAGGELWLLLDDLGAPIVASTPEDAGQFTLQLKATVQQCSLHARTVGSTGSGMLSLLTAIRAAPPSGFVLWDAIQHVRLGWEPSPPAALAMAQGILAAYASQWPPACAAAATTPQAVLAQLACSAHSQLTSPRPALVACLAGLMGPRPGKEGSPAGQLAAATQALLQQLRLECARDTAVALERMPRPQLQALHALAVAGRQPAAP